jgi:hypothetical protein
MNIDTVDRKRRKMLGKKPLENTVATANAGYALGATLQVVRW